MNRARAFLVLSGCVVIAACSSSSSRRVESDEGRIPPPRRIAPAESGFEGPPAILRPDFGETVALAKAPPPLGAASIIVVNEATAVATDPDRDQVIIANLTSKTAQTILFAEGEEPSRLVADETGHRVFVVLRRSGSVATIDLDTLSLTERRPVCAAPQGIARDKDTLYVACLDGELVKLSTTASSPAIVLTKIADRDLRDVVITPQTVLVSRLRKAEIVEINKTTGEIVSRATPPHLFLRRGGDVRPEQPFAGWRMIADGTGNGAVLVHQVASTSELNVSVPSAYGSGLLPCSSVVNTTATTFVRGSTDLSSPLEEKSHIVIDNAVAPVDIALSKQGRWLVVAAGNGHTPERVQIHHFASLANGGPDICWPETHDNRDPVGQVVSAAFTPDESVVAFTREPAGAHLYDRATKSWSTIKIGGPSVEDTGHAIFHSNAGVGMACVSCHPEGGDDGRVWSLSTGRRRTQTLKGTLEGTAPYHWGGDAPDIETFATDVFAGRMAGSSLAVDQIDALKGWLTHIPAPPKAKVLTDDLAAIERGKALFESTTVGCSSCHSGAMFTNNESADVGTGGKFQVPSLIGLRAHAPYFHDGRADTLLERFNAAIGGGDRHGSTTSLKVEERDDLIKYLETL